MDHDANNWPKIALAWLGNLLGYLTVHQAEIQTVVLLLTGAWTLWQFGMSITRDARDRALHRKLLAKVSHLPTEPGDTL